MMENNENEVPFIEKMRHTASHVLAQAVLSLFPDTKLGIGPAIDDGFYYDFEFSQPISEDDLKKLEKKMKEIIKKDLPLKRVFIPRDEAIKRLKEKGQDYKLDLLKDIKDDPLSFYITGDNDFVDLCRGPHIESTGQIGAIKLLRIAGAYWRGNEKNKMLTRIYGTAFETKEDLDKYLRNLELAEKNNHRTLGKKLKLFAIIPEIGKGLPVWLPKGYAIRRTLEQYMYEFERSYGYVHVLTPHINKEELFRTSGHLDFYKDSMYSPIEIDNETYYLKPMNCPAGMMIYKLEPKSYKDLPLKLGEFGTVYRYEKSGELHGLQRVRGFTQNDAHIFCTPEQIEEQFMEVLEMLQKFYKDIGFNKYYYRLSLSDDSKKFSIKPREEWLKVEGLLKKVLDKVGADYVEAVGEAAFYGPKLDVQAQNVFGKEDTISTIQIDFNLPERFDLTYVDKNGEKQRPYVIHRALVGSFERFFAFMIEHYAGAFPLWLSPEQVRIIPVSKDFVEYAKSILDLYRSNKINVTIDDRDESIGARIRDAEVEKIPYVIVVGNKEVSTNTVSVRATGEQELGAFKVDEFLQKLIEEIKTKKVRG